MSSYYGKHTRRAVNQYYSPDDFENQSPRSGIPFFLFFALLACIVGAVIVPGGLGAWVGYQELQEQNKGNAELHYQRGLGYLDENYPELAYTEFVIALKYDPTHAAARQKFDELDKSFGARSTPGAPDSNVAPALYEQAKGLIAKKQWSDAIIRLEQLRTLNAEYNASEVSTLLYQAYVEGGKEAVGLAQIELARERFDAALAIKSSDAEIQRQRELAGLYLEGQQYAGSKWDLAAQKFAAVYDKDPNYADVKKRLLEADLMYGDAAMKQNAPCLALRSFDNAISISTDSQVAQKRAQASAQCKDRLASPPAPTLSAAETYTWKISATAAPCTGTGDLSGIVRDVSGKIIVGATVSYANDAGARTSAKTNNNGQYLFNWGKDPALYHISILAADGKTPTSAVVDIGFLGGTNPNCHVVLDWQKLQ